MGRNATQRKKRTNKRKAQRGGADVNELCDLIYENKPFNQNGVGHGAKFQSDLVWNSYFTLNTDASGNYIYTYNPQPTVLLKSIINTLNMPKRQSPLYIACRFNPYMVEYLLNAGANPNIINGDGSTPAIGCTYIDRDKPPNLRSFRVISTTLTQLIGKGADLSLAKGAETPFKNLQIAADARLLLP
jgi:hypothetical protein